MLLFLLRPYVINVLCSNRFGDSQHSLFPKISISLLQQSERESKSVCVEFLCSRQKLFTVQNQSVLGKLNVSFPFIPQVPLED